MEKPYWSTLRAISQLLFWLIFITLLIYTRDPIEDAAIYNIFPRLSIHLGIASSLVAQRVLDAFYPSLIILGLTLLLGRFFCGWICPLGITIDATDRIFNRKKRNILLRAGKKVNIKPYKFLVLLVSIILSIAGIHASGIIDPLSLSFRSYSTALYPYFDSLLKLIFLGLYYVPFANSISEPVYAILKDSVLAFNDIQFHGHLTVFLIFLLVIALSLFARRFWCQSLCPLGAALSLTSRFSLFRRVVDHGQCVNCLQCERDCRINAIYGDGESTLEGECIKCFECLKSCKYDAISFQLTLPFRKTKQTDQSNSERVKSPRGEDLDISRRNLLLSLTSSLIMIPLFRLNPEYTRDHASIIRPPGALPEHKFVDSCIRCGECMKVCPTNALHPTLLEAGLEGVFTPRLIPKLGYCEKNCILCSKVCPTDALKKLKISDKETTIFGTAYFIRDLCYPWAEQRNCIVCEEVCPTKTKAIKFHEKWLINKKGKRVQVKLPYVLENVCIGCGICENKCPVPGSAAIVVRTPKIVSDEKLFR
jgi:MauM/NapG family ferredoxin protein